MARSFADIQSAPIGTPLYKGVIDATGTSKTNAQASVPFSLTAEATVLIHAAIDCYLVPVTSSTATVTAANGVPHQANEKSVITLAPGYTHIAVIRASSSGNVSFWELLS